jgi:putative tryptophan/tyrosine transport system substrate-binding protein
MTAVQDAVADGLVESLAHPGGNVTGRSVYAQELTSKRMELLKDVVPGLLRVGVLWNAHVAGSIGQLREAEKAGCRLVWGSCRSARIFLRVSKMQWPRPYKLERARFL